MKFKKSVLLTLGITGSSVLMAGAQQHPNVILIITDDQGYGDLGITGNPNIRTPNIDRFAGESARFTNFYVSPVSAPTRSSLMTGRYSLRTGVRDTNNGGAIMASSEITIAEMLKDKGYVTGIFGKWHLGDNYPSRPMDQGFDESLIHLTGGMAQPGDITTYLRGDSAYFDPILWHNGRQKNMRDIVQMFLPLRQLPSWKRTAQSHFSVTWLSMHPILLFRSLKNIIIYTETLIPLPAFPKNSGSQ
jgi:hypothetical protein